MTAELSIEQTAIDGLLALTLPVHGDARGWFKENWQRAKMTALGLPDFGPVQNNVSFNTDSGTTRGLHAEPWDKLVSVATGRVFGAWVELREGDGFGTLVTRELGPGESMFVPRGVANGFQTLEPNTAYSYLVNDHWRPDLTYSMVNLADPELAVPWPVPLEQATVSDKDRQHPLLADAVPFAEGRIAILGGGQVAKALQKVYPEARLIGRAELDFADAAAVESFDFGDFSTVINAVAMTKVDAAETDEGRREAWQVNATSVAALVRNLAGTPATLVHFSSDYVHDGSDEVSDEDSPIAPLGVYGQSKAAGDLVVSCFPRHYLIRTSWVIGEGHNFIATMRSLAERGISPSVVSDQHGRLSHTDNIAAAVAHLLSVKAPYGTYNVTDSGPATTWAEIASQVFDASGAAGVVTPVSTADYFGDKPHAPRPTHSVLSLDKIIATGYQPTDQTGQQNR
ncbi:dTDP-4-dehydrorhamnose 3,5-epimerase [Naumannella halotolerans]|uniref:dTDP-4-dehydrorhamnose 3,5-epimerase n=1 Tax=Naumannella halotolerans TaxID=993414 RepID=A0A4R7IZ36_9ACTN|nr:bifunctional dTDP-4-dehydrorhamnose 3,5-epimerase family protein/NAD(P)-dependent oxidoreductase [Naumannella halotolerans]TDT29965.1 dTDP-4-dehydrorhamnose 3,5-epimerase [Naumannella halotolerans]